MTPPRATLDAAEVAAVWGISTWAVYDLAKKDDLPVAPLTFGRTLRWPASAVAASVGVDVGELLGADDAGRKNESAPEGALADRLTNGNVRPDLISRRSRYAHDTTT